MGCRRRAPQDELLRICIADGRTDIDPTRHAAGRGAYVCSDVRCFDKATSKGRLARALRAPVRSEDIERMREKIGE